MNCPYYYSSHIFREDGNSAAPKTDVKVWYEKLKNFEQTAGRCPFLKLLQATDLLVNR